MDANHLTILLALFALLLAIGTPIAFALGLTATGVLLLSVDTLPALATVAQRLATGLDSFALLAIPCFLLAGELMNRGGAAKRLVAFGRALIGGLAGGLIYVDILACLLFGAISGSAVAATAAIGGFMIPRMEEDGLDRSFATAVNLTSATTGLLVPPSNILIVYSLASGGVSIAALFVAGYLPGILVALLLAVVAGLMAGSRGASHRETLGSESRLLEVARTFVDALPSLLLIVIVMGGIVAGVFTATEAAGVAVAYAFVLAVVVYREIELRQLPRLLADAAATTGVVMLLIATSMAFSWVLAFERLPQAIAQALLGLADQPWALLLVINLLLLVVGTVMDMTPAVLIFTPILLPVAEQIGIDKVHFGIIMVLNLCIGLCTPPVGTVLFVGLGVSNEKLERVLPYLLPLWLAMIFALVLVTLIPAISLWLPGLLL